MTPPNARGWRDEYAPTGTGTRPPPSRERRGLRTRGDGGTVDRGQANLLALAAALIILTSATVLAIAAADGALAGAARDPGERRAATQLSDRLVADAPVAYRANVLNGSATTNLSGSTVDDLAPAVRGRAVRVRLGGETVFERGDPGGGTTVGRVVLVGERSAVSTPVDFERDRTLTLESRTAQVRIAFASGADVDSVRADGRIVLHDPVGLAGTYDVRVPRSENLTLRFEDVGGPEGSATVTHYPVNATATGLAVTVDA